MVAASATATAAVAGLTALSAGSDPALTSARTAAGAVQDASSVVALTATDLAPDLGREGGAESGDASLSAADLEERVLSVSRSDARAIEAYEASSADFVADPTRESVLTSGTEGVAITVEEDLTQQDPRDIALELMPEYGLSTAEFGCLDSLWVSESDWDMHADNPTSTAYGIPQALMSAWDLPADYTTNPVTQIEWGLWYIEDTYGTACAAWDFKQANNWY
ncbi:lytic transglycosylase domain-containing protein [Nocardioidaceae bacterium]|nr:lytic transglycosylase domain-containing protein [Nocardioidaceae bacterium]